jgi:hypothetical protein
MKVFIATVVHIENTEILGVYSTEDVALGKVEKRMEELYESNEDYGAYPEVIEAAIDDINTEDYF